MNSCPSTSAHKPKSSAELLSVFPLVLGGSVFQDAFSTCHAGFCPVISLPVSVRWFRCRIVGRSRLRIVLETKSALGMRGNSLYPNASVDASMSKYQHADVCHGPLPIAETYLYVHQGMSGPAMPCLHSTSQDGFFPVYIDATLLTDRLKVLVGTVSLACRRSRLSRRTKADIFSGAGRGYG